MGVGEAVAIVTRDEDESKKDRMVEQLAVSLVKVRDVLRVCHAHDLFSSEITRELVHAARQGASSRKLGWVIRVLFWTRAMKPIRARTVALSNTLVLA